MSNSQLVESTVQLQNQISLVNKIELEAQVSTAKFYPRNIQQAIANTLTTATLSLDIAQSCIYAKPVDKKIINGPSVRLAEIFLGEWGNIKGGTRVLPAESKTITGEAVIWDLEKNINFVVQKTRRITTSDGRRYGESMIETTGNAAAAIAKRDAIFTVIPRAVIFKVYDQIKEFIEKNGLESKPGADPKVLLLENIKKGVAFFEAFGILEANLLNILNKRSLSELDHDDYITMLGIKNGLKDKTLTKQDLMSDDPVEGVDPALTKGDQLRIKMKQKGDY